MLHFILHKKTTDTQASHHLTLFIAAVEIPPQKEESTYVPTEKPQLLCTKQNGVL